MCGAPVERATDLYPLFGTQEGCFHNRFRQSDLRKCHLEEHTVNPSLVERFLSAIRIRPCCGRLPVSRSPATVEELKWLAESPQGGHTVAGP